MGDTVARALLAAALIEFLSACGGGGSSSTGIPVTATPSATATPAFGTAQLRLVIPSVGVTARHRHRRMPAYVSDGTQAFAISINSVPVPSSSISQSCTSSTPVVCTINVQAPPGNDLFDIALGDASGNLLSEGSVTAAITTGQITQLHLTFLGLPAYATLKFDNANPDVGTPGDVHISAVAFDALSNQIIGDDYLRPIVVTSGPSEHTQMAGSVLTNPSSTITVHYDGKLMTSGVTFSVSTPSSTKNVSETFLGSAIQTFATTYAVRSLANGPDGNVWFTECGSNTLGSCKVGYVTPSGQVTESVNVPWAEFITAGPDGAMWFTEANRAYLGRITPSMQFSEFQIKALAPNEGYYAGPILSGPDGNLWFVQADALVQFSTAGEVLNKYPLPNGWCYSQQMILDSAGTFWIGQLGYVVNATTGGTLANYQLYDNTPNVPVVNAAGFAAMPDGRVFFNYNGFKTITRGGTVTPYTMPSSTNKINGFLAYGPDQNLWGTGYITTSGDPNNPSNALAGMATMTPATGAVLVYPFAPGKGAAGNYGVWGADGNLWLPSPGISRFRYNP